MKLARLFWSLLRYRVAVLLLPFFFLALALHGALTHFAWNYVAGLLTLGCSYVVATALNDLSDEDVDRINHPHGRGRPLVSGEATAPQLRLVAAVAAVLCLASALVIGPVAVLVVAASLTVNVAYSTPPLRLSYRTWLAPLVLAFAYVALPYAMGLAALGAKPAAQDAWTATAFCVLFAARMLLKDFRDREGDAAYGKRSFLLRYGKLRTCAATGAVIALGNVLFVTALPAGLRADAPVFEVFFAGALVALVALALAADPDSEQVAIGVGAKFGNGALLTLIALLALNAAGADQAEQRFFAVLMAAAYCVTSVLLVRQPNRAILAYRG